MARLGLAQVATFRVGSVALLRGRMPTSRPAAAGRGTRTAPRVLAARRSLRRARSAEQVALPEGSEPVAPE